MAKFISVVIPTYNERDNIVNLIRVIRSILIKHKYRFEVIVVDDDSRDKTAENIKKTYGSNRNVKLIVRKKERGLGTAILKGIKISRGDIIIGMDADFNHDPLLIPHLLSQIGKKDMIIGSRFIYGGGMDDKKRYIATYVFNLFLKYLLGFPTMDNMSGFYAVKRKRLLTLPIDRIYRGYGEYHLRLVYLAKKRGFDIGEMPVFYGARSYGESKSNLLKMFFHYLFTAFELKLKGDKI